MRLTDPPTFAGPDHDAFGGNAVHTNNAFTHHPPAPLRGDQSSPSFVYAHAPASLSGALGGDDRGGSSSGAVDLTSLMTALPTEAEVESGVPGVVKDTAPGGGNYLPGGSSRDRRGVTTPPGTFERHQNGNSSQHSNVYVKNLAEDVDETSLKRMFNKFGVVESCCVIRDVSTNASRGFGFVKFQNVHQARHAIGSTHGLSVRGRSLEVKFANSDSTTAGGVGPHGGGVGVVSDNVYVKGLPPQWQERELREFFSTFGNIIECRLLHASGTTTAGALIRFELIEQAITAVVNANNVVPQSGSVPLVMRFADSHGKGPGGRGKTDRDNSRNGSGVSSRGNSVSNGTHLSPDEFLGGSPYARNGHGQTQTQTPMSNVLLAQHNSVSLAMLQHQQHGQQMHTQQGHQQMHSLGGTSNHGSLNSLGSFGSLGHANAAGGGGRPPHDGNGGVSQTQPPFQRNNSFHESIDEGSAHDGRRWQTGNGSFGSFGGSPRWGPAAGGSLEFQGSPESANGTYNGNFGQRDERGTLGNPGEERRRETHASDSASGERVGGLSAMFAIGGSMDHTATHVVAFGETSLETPHENGFGSRGGVSLSSFPGARSPHGGSAADSLGSRGSSIRGGNNFGPGSVLAQQMPSGALSSQSAREVNGSTRAQPVSPVGSFDQPGMWARGPAVETGYCGPRDNSGDSGATSVHHGLDRAATPGITALEARAMLDRLETETPPITHTHASSESEPEATRSLLVRRRSDRQFSSAETEELYLWRTFAPRGVVVSIHSTGVQGEHVVAFSKACDANTARVALDGGALGDLHVMKLGNSDSLPGASSAS